MISASVLNFSPVLIHNDSFLILCCELVTIFSSSSRTHITVQIKDEPEHTGEGRGFNVSVETQWVYFIFCIFWVVRFALTTSWLCSYNERWSVCHSVGVCLPHTTLPRGHAPRPPILNKTSQSTAVLSAKYT